MVGQSIRESSGWMDVDKITGNAPNWINLYERLYRIKLRWQKWLIWFNLRASESIWVFRGRRRDPGPSNPRLRQSCGLCQLLIACEHSYVADALRKMEGLGSALELHIRSRKFSEKLKISLMDAVGVSCCYPWNLWNLFLKIGRIQKLSELKFLFQKSNSRASYTPDISRLQSEIFPFHRRPRNSLATFNELHVSFPEKRKIIKYSLPALPQKPTP